MLVFWIGDKRWAIATADIKEVLPLVNLQEIACVHSGLVGLIDYRGHMVRTFDLSSAISGKSAPAVISTRIVLVEVNGDRFALIAERVEGIYDLSENVGLSEISSYAQAIWKDAQGIVQQLSLDAVVAQVLEPAALKPMCLLSEG